MVKKIFISSEANISDSEVALEKGGVWLVAEMNPGRAFHYLNPGDLIAWIEGQSINAFNVFPELPEDVRSELCKKFDEELHRIVL